MNLEANAVTVDSNWVERSALFRELAAERDEILKHKWLESEKFGRDIGFENAVMSWVIHHRAQWRRWHRQPTMSEAAGLISPGGLPDVLFSNWTFDQMQPVSQMRYFAG